MGVLATLLPERGGANLRTERRQDGRIGLNDPARKKSAHIADRPENATPGHAALSMCESLLIAMIDLEVMSEKDIRGLLEDAAAAHHEASSNSANSDLHQEVAALIDHIVAGGNSMRRFW